MSAKQHYIREEAEKLKQFCATGGMKTHCLKSKTLERKNKAQTNIKKMRILDIKQKTAQNEVKRKYMRENKQPPGCVCGRTSACGFESYLKVIFWKKPLKAMFWLSVSEFSYESQDRWVPTDEAKHCLGTTL